MEKELLRISCLLDIVLPSQDRFHKLSLIFRIEYPERQVYKLCFRQNEKIEIFAYKGFFYVFPFHRHALLGIKFDQDLLAGYLITQSFKKYFILLQLGNTCKLNKPE